MSSGEVLPEIIPLTKPLLDVLKLDSKTAYALQPCFASRVQVYAPSRTEKNLDPWLPHIILIGQNGHIYLLDLNPAFSGCIANAAMLRCDKLPADTTDQPIVEIEVEDPPNAIGRTQCVYIRCSQRLSLSHIWEAKMQSENPNNVTGVSATENLESAREKTKGEVTSPMFPPFVYLLRFHCKTLPMGLHFVQIVSLFTDRSRGELLLRRADASSSTQHNPTPIVDPAVSSYYSRIDTKTLSKQKLSLSMKAGSFKQSPSRSITNGLSLEQTPILHVRDVAQYEEKQFSAVGKEIPISPPLNFQRRRQPVVVPLLEYDNQEDVPVNEPQLLEGDAQGSSLDTGASMKIYPLVPYSKEASRDLHACFLEAQSRHFTFPAADDLLVAHGTPGFDSQFALFLLEDHVKAAMALRVKSLLARYPRGASAAQDQLLAREIAREELLAHFGAVYGDLCATTRRRMSGISPESLAAEAERARALQALQDEAAAREALEAREESGARFGEDQTLRSPATGLPLEPLCAEEAEWRAELAETAAALEAVEQRIRRLDESVAGEKGGMGATHAEDTAGGDGRTMGRFTSVEEEAGVLLREIQEEELRLEKITQSQESAEHKMLDGQLSSQGDFSLLQHSVSELSDATAEEVGRLRVEYNTWVLQQQEEIDRLRADLQGCAARFGVDPQWMTQLNSRPRIVDEVLERTK